MNILKKILRGVDRIQKSLFDVDEEGILIPSDEFEVDDEDNKKDIVVH